MKPIGGYFSLELPLREEYHAQAIKLNTGRNALEYILRCRQCDKVYIPYYTCGVVLEPFEKLGIEYQFYHVNHLLEVADDISLLPGETILYTNYFGLKQDAVKQLARRYGHQLIIDNTQAFYDKPISGIDTFYTCRKFFGVPDGAYLYTDEETDLSPAEDHSWERMDFLLKRIDLSPEEGYADFRRQSGLLVGVDIRQMSRLTQRLMQSIDYDAAATRRRENFMYLHKALHASNLLSLHLAPEAVPMVYPYMTDDEGLRDRLINQKVFVARYWPNVLEWSSEGSLEHTLTKHILPLPIDQRYDEADMLRITSLIKDKR